MLWQAFRPLLGRETAPVVRRLRLGECEQSAMNHAPVAGIPRLERYRGINDVRGM